MKQNNNSIWNRNPSIPEARHDSGQKPYLIIDGVSLSLYVYNQLQKGDKFTKEVFIEAFFNYLIKITKADCQRPEKTIIVWGKGNENSIRKALMPEYEVFLSGFISDKRLERLYKYINIINKLFHGYGIPQIIDYDMEVVDLLYIATLYYSKISKVITVTYFKTLYPLITRDITIFNPQYDVTYSPELLSIGNYGLPVRKILDFLILTGNPLNNVDGYRGMEGRAISGFLNIADSIKTYLGSKKEVSGFIDKDALKKIYKKNRRVLDLSWANRHYYEGYVMQFYKDKRDPETNLNLIQEMSIELGIELLFEERTVNYILSWKED